MRVPRPYLFVLRTPDDLNDRELPLARLKLKSVGGTVLRAVAGSFLLEGSPDLAQSLPR